MGGELYPSKYGTAEMLVSGMDDTGGASLSVRMLVERSSHIENMDRSRPDNMAAVELSSRATGKKASLRLLSRGASDHRVLHGRTDGCMMPSTEKTEKNGRSQGCGSRRRDVEKWVARRGSSAGLDVACPRNAGTDNENVSNGGIFRASEVVKATWRPKADDRLLVLLDGSDFEDPIVLGIGLRPELDPNPHLL